MADSSSLGAYQILKSGGFHKFLLRFGLDLATQASNAEFSDIFQRKTIQN
jgi:hypothetical protein